MYNGGGFGSFGGGGGGGFGGGFDNDPGLVSPKVNRQNNNQGGVVPVTIYMMLNAVHEPNQDTFTFENTDINMVSFVGIIRDVTETTTSITYKIDDYTGPYMSVRKFITEGDGDVSSLPKSNCYVRVYGHLRSMGETRNVIAFSIRPVQTHNEKTSHMLDVVRSVLYHQKKSKLTSAPGMDVKVDGDSTGRVGNENDSRANNKMGDNPLCLNSQQQQVYVAMKNGESDIGMSITEISKAVGGCMNTVQVKKAIEFLSNEGHIYSTIDDEHYKLTDMY